MVCPARAIARWAGQRSRPRLPAAASYLYYFSHGPWEGAGCSAPEYNGVVTHGWADHGADLEQPQPLLLGGGGRGLLAAPERIRRFIPPSLKRNRAHGGTVTYRAFLFFVCGESHCGPRLGPRDVSFQKRKPPFFSFQCHKAFVPRRRVSATQARSKRGCSMPSMPRHRAAH